MLFLLQERVQAQEVLKMFSAPVNQEFFGSAEPGAARSALAAQAQTDLKEEDKPERRPAEAAAGVQEEKLSKVRAGEEPASGAKTGKAAPKGRSAAKAKTKTKQTGKKGSKAAAKKTAKGATRTGRVAKAAVSGSQDGRDEL